MSTRSWVAVQSASHDKEGGVCQFVYSHYDGYPSGVGLTLLQHYNAKSKAKQLVSGGDISIIDWNGQDVLYYAKRGSWKDPRGGGDEPWDQVKPRWKNNKQNLLNAFRSDEGMMIAYLYIYETDLKWHCYKVDYDTKDIIELELSKEHLVKSRNSDYDNYIDDNVEIGKVA